MTQNHEPRHIKATATWTGTYWKLTFNCQNCGNTHHHGGGTGPQPEGGHRSSHCTANPSYPDGGYILDL